MRLELEILETRCCPSGLSFKPAEGLVGSQVAITGTGFDNTVKDITFGSVPTTSFTVDSSTEISVTVPDGAKSGPIGVDTSGGSTGSTTNYTVIPTPIVTFSSPSGGSALTITDPTAQQSNTIIPFPGFTGSLRTAVADVTGSGHADVIVGQGPGGNPNIRIFDSTTGQQIAGPTGSFNAFNPSFTGGVYVAAGDVTGAGYADIIVATDAGGGPDVTIFDGKSGSVVSSFFAFSPSFTGGVRLAVGDILGTGKPDIIAASGPSTGFTPMVSAFDGSTGTQLLSVSPFDSTFTGGLNVASGDLTGAGHADIIVGAGPGSSPQVEAFDGITGHVLKQFAAYDPSVTNGVRVASLMLNGKADIVTGQAPTGNQLHAFDSTGQDVTASFTGNPLFNSGIFPEFDPIVATTTALYSSAGNNNPILGQPVTFTATVSPASMGTVGVTGTVDFTIDNGTPQAVPLNSSDQATLAISNLSLGAHTISAAYSGDSNYSASTSAPLPQTVTYKLVVTSAPPSTLTPGSPFDLTVTAQDANGNVDTAFNGSVTITSAPAAFLYVAESSPKNDLVKVTPSGGRITVASGVTGGAVFDSNINLYYVSGNNVDKVTPAGAVSTFATGFSQPGSLAIDSSGNLYVSSGNNVDQVTPAGTVSTFASGFNGPGDLYFDGSGNLYVVIFNTGSQTSTVSKVTPGGTVTTFASVSGEAGGVAFDSSGNLYVGTFGNLGNTVFKVTPGGTVTTFASGVSGGKGGLAFDSSGNLYVGVFAGLGDTVSKVTPAGTVSTFATVSVPGGLAIDSSGNLYVTSVAPGTVSKVTPAGTVSTFTTGFTEPYSPFFGPANAPGTLTGPTSMTAVNGMATFSGLALSPTGSYSLTLSSSGLTSATQTISARPATDTWTGKGGDNKWSDPSNWAAGVIPDPGDDLIFPDGAAGFQADNDISGSITYHSLTFSGTAGGYTISGLGIGISGSVTNTAGSNTIAAPVFGGGSVVTNAGTLTLAGNNSHTGTVTVSPGSDLDITNNNGLGAASVTTIQSTGANNGGSLVVAPNLTIAQPLVINGTGNSNTNSAGAIHIAAAGGAVSETFNSVTLGSDSTLFSETGITTVTLNGLVQTNGHNLSIQGVTSVVLTSTTSVLGGGGLLLFPGTTLTESGTGATAVTGNVAFNGTAGFQANFSGTSSSQLTVSGTVTISSTATLNFNVDPSFNPPPNANFIILQSTGAFTGQFQNHPEGSIVTLNGRLFVVHYFSSANGDPGLELSSQLVQPTITSVSPDSALVGSQVTIVGTNFFGVSAVSFNGTAAASFAVDPTMTQITATVPAGASSGPISVTAGDFTVTSANFTVLTNWTPLTPHVYVTAADAGGQPKVKVFDATSGAVLDDFFAYASGMTAGIRVAAADLQGDGTPDIIVVPGPGAGSIVEVFDGRNGQMRLQFAAFTLNGQLFDGGQFVAAADILGQGYDDIIISADAGGGPAVAVFDGKTGQQVMFFFAFPDAASGAVFTGGVRVAAGPYTPDGPAVIYTAAGPGGGPAVSVWSAADITANQSEKTFYAIPPDANGNLFTGGVYLGAVSAGDGRDYLVTGAAPGGGPAITLIDPLNTPATSAFGLFVGQPFYALDSSFTGGVRVAGGAGVLVTVPGPGGTPIANSFNLAGAPLATLDASDPDNPNFFGGLFVAAA